MTLDLTRVSTRRVRHRVYACGRCGVVFKVPACECCGVPAILRLSAASFHEVVREPRPYFRQHTRGVESSSLRLSD